MKKILIPMLMITAFATMASAGSLNSEGTIPNLAQDTTWLADRVGLVNDGSFEDGFCGAGSGWTCSTSGTCEIITDMTGFGLWNYDGDYVAWLGGFCSGPADVFESVCQDIFIDGDILEWYWMIYIDTDGDRVTLTIDGDLLHEYFLSFGDHLAGYQPESVNVGAYLGATHTVCFNYDLINSGGNYFLDYVSLDASVATEEMSFSTVKSLF